jgi:hypothetical protein
MQLRPPARIGIVNSYARVLFVYAALDFVFTMWKVRQTAAAVAGIDVSLVSPLPVYRDAMLLGIAALLILLRGRVLLAVGVDRVTATARVWWRLALIVTIAALPIVVLHTVVAKYGPVFSEPERYPWVDTGTSVVSHTIAVVSSFDGFYMNGGRDLLRVVAASLTFLVLTLLCSLLRDDTGWRSRDDAELAVAPDAAPPVVQPSSSGVAPRR